MNFVRHGGGRGAALLSSVIVDVVECLGLFLYFFFLWEEMVASLTKKRLKSSDRDTADKVVSAGSLKFSEWCLFFLLVLLLFFSTS